MTTFASSIAKRPMMLRLSTAAELMTSDPLSFDKNMPIPKAGALLKLHSLDAAPMTDEFRRLVGVVTASACDAWAEFTLRSSPQRFVQQMHDRTPVAEIANPVVESVRRNTAGQEVVDRLVQRRARRIYVVNDWNELIGVISMSDVLRHLTEAGYSRRAEPACFC
jgi:CBS-domain-containing membrane protein